MTPRTLKLLSQTLAAILFLIAGSLLLFGSNKGVGIVAVLVAAVTARLLVLDIPAWLESRQK